MHSFYFKLHIQVNLRLYSINLLNPKSVFFNILIKKTIDWRKKEIKMSMSPTMKK